MPQPRKAPAVAQDAPKTADPAAAAEDAPETPHVVTLDSAVLDPSFLEAWAHIAEGSRHRLLTTSHLDSPRTVSDPVRTGATQLIEDLRKNRDSLPSGI
jgi:hypothetical protein